VENQLESKEEALTQIVQSQDQIRYKGSEWRFLAEKLPKDMAFGVSSD